MTFGFSGGGSDGPTTVDQGMISEVRAYWEALRDGEMLPRRALVDPRGIANALEHSFLIERIAPGLARFRIAGMAFNDLMGMDIRGMPISSLFLGEARMRLQMELERMFHGPAILSLELGSERGLGRPPMTARMVVLPMLGQQDDCNLAIGCIEITGEIGRAPRRFTIEGAKIEQVSHSPKAGVPDEMAQNARQPAQDLAFAETPAPFTPPRPAPGVPYLRLVKG
ncbi:MAG: PAS domain-containing protein [Rhodobacteraceae bacterium]|nr:PAS domain-containing protein [Paracoccaceae bacterium]MCF8513984.1 PAS domain-containing protein [Paracoccaceae bacterium]MCF8518228.1 PAS domain-containing protein [Paracoccaceae bacterium]